jgi:hypothetical protein
MFFKLLKTIQTGRFYSPNFNFTGAILFVVSVFCSHGLMAQSIDTLHLQNEYSFSGKLIKCTSSQMSFEADGIGILQVNVEKVKFLHASSSVFRIETSTYRNIDVYDLTYHRDTFFFSMEGNRDVISSITINEINSIIPLSFNSHSGSISMGHTFALSNQVGLFNLDLNYSYTTRKYGVHVLSSGIYSLIERSLVRNKENINLNLLRSVGYGFSAGLVATYDRNENQNLRARYQLAAGAKYNLYDVNTLKVNFVSGLLLSNERSKEQLNENNWVIPFQMNVVIADPKNSKWSVQLNQNLHGQLSFDRMRSESELRGSMKFNQRISFSAYLYNMFDSRPLSPEGSKHDYGWTIGVRVNF